MNFIFNILLFLLKFILFILFILVIAFIISFVAWFFYYRVVKGLKFPKSISEYKPYGLFKRLFYQFPKMFWLDRFNRVPRRVSRVWFTSILWRTG